MKFTQNTTLILDGAMGTELQRRGIPTTLPLWSAHALFENPEVVKEIHKDYILAGADIITTNTFRTQRRTLAKAGHEDETEAINRLAVDLAVQARKETRSSRRVHIAGSMTTLEDCYAPDLVPDNTTCRREHAEQAQILAGTPIDFFLLETFNTVREARAAAEAVTRTGKPFAISFMTATNGHLLSGESLEDAIAAIDDLAPMAYLVNCQSPVTATRCILALSELTSVPFGAYANGVGHPDIHHGWVFANGTSAEKYAEAAREWKAIGASIIGGCCGTTPEYTKAYNTLKS
ncbi:MAG: homocysteine S-methyltransferase family protein [Candidatus Kerfeldbacteria bacterium]|nr:homocysteine S-methyltransferase family protein [Candidatus Kerfeldbacteria bacterium]